MEGVTPPLGAAWEVTYDPGEPLQLVQLGSIDFAGIEQSWSDDERERLDSRLTWLLDNAETWEAPGWGPARGEPVTLVYECNWRGASGAWQRMVHGFTAGRHRLLAARQLGRPTIRAKVLEQLFFPPGDRPADRIEVPTSSDRRVLLSTDHPNAGHTTGSSV